MEKNYSKNFAWWSMAVFGKNLKFGKSFQNFGRHCGIVSIFEGNIYPCNLRSKRETWDQNFGASSGSGSDCCPLVVDPLTFIALLGFIGVSTYFFAIYNQNEFNGGMKTFFEI